MIVVIGYADASHSVAYSPTVGFNASSSNPNIIDTYNSSVLNVTGGTLTALAAFDSSTMNISGGVVSAQINVDDSATLNITGGDEESPESAPTTAVRSTSATAAQAQLNAAVAP